MFCFCRWYSVICTTGYVAAAGASSCSSCSTGYYATDSTTDTGGGIDRQVLSGASSCNKCPAGYYQDFTQAAARWMCTACAGGQYSASGAFACLDCAAAKYSAGGVASCSSCEPGKFNTHAGLSYCSDCETGSYSEAGSTACPLCDSGYYYPLDESSGCQACPTGAACFVANGTGSSTQLKLPVDYGYWRISETTTTLRACPNPDWCSGGRNFSYIGKSYCREGHRSPLCSTCKKNDYFMDSNTNLCTECKKEWDPQGGEDGTGAWVNAKPDPLAYILSVPAIVLYALIAFAVLASSANNIRKKMVRQRIDEAERSAAKTMGTSFEAKLTPPPAGFLEQLVMYCLGSSMRLRKTFKRNEVTFKALTSFAQIATSMGMNFSMKWPPVVQSIMDKLGVVNLNFVPALELECMIDFDYCNIMTAYMLFPIFICVVLLLGNEFAKVQTTYAHKKYKTNEKLIVPIDLEGKFTDAEVGNLRATFCTYDVDGSGSIDKEELRKVLHEFKYDDAEVDKIFEEANVDGDEIITFHEFITLMDKERHDGQSSTFAIVAERLEFKVNLQRSQTVFYLFLTVTFLVLIGNSTMLFQFFKCTYFDEADPESSTPLGFAYLSKDLSLDCYSSRYQYYFVFTCIMLLVYPFGEKMI